MPGSQRCEVYGCGQCRSKATADIAFHKFPNDEARKELWMNALKLASPDWNDKLNPLSTVCSKHFRTNDYESANMLSDEEGICFSKRLKKDSVPSVFVPVEVQSPESQPYITSFQNEMLTVFMLQSTSGDSKSTSVEDESTSVPLPPSRHFKTQRVKAIQTNKIQIKYRSKYCQTRPMGHTRSIECQTLLTVEDIARMERSSGKSPAPISSDRDSEKDYTNDCNGETLSCTRHPLKNRGGRTRPNIIRKDRWKKGRRKTHLVHVEENPVKSEWCENSLSDSECADVHVEENSVKSECCENSLSDSECADDMDVHYFKREPLSEDSCSS